MYTRCWSFTQTKSTSPARSCPTFTLYPSGLDARVADAGILEIELVVGHGAFLPLHVIGNADRRHRLPCTVGQETDQVVQERDVPDLVLEDDVLDKGGVQICSVAKYEHYSQFFC